MRTMDVKEATLRLDGVDNSVSILRYQHDEENAKAVITWVTGVSVSALIHPHRIDDEDGSARALCGVYGISPGCYVAKGTSALYLISEDEHDKSVTY